MHVTEIETFESNTDQSLSMVLDNIDLAELDQINLPAVLAAFSDPDLPVSEVTRKCREWLAYL